MKDDGGPAFPNILPETQVGGGWDSGMTLRDYFIAHAPAQEISDLVPSDINGCAAYIGIPPEEYKGESHYLLVLAKARGAWADAMIAERTE